MGQYQQWLAAQETERRLQAEIETLETELFYLQDRITVMEQVVPTTENVILQALTAYLQDQAEQKRQSPEGKTQDQTASGEPVQTGRSDAPRTPKFQMPEQEGEKISPYLPRAYSQNALSEDMLAFFDKRSQTDPDLATLLQRERQLANVAGSSTDQGDTETRRLNENIQRWFVRWHRETADRVLSEEAENEQ